jgi:hypothetical protein
MSDHLVAETSIYTTHITHSTKIIHAPGVIGTHNLSKRAAAYLRFRPRGHSDRLWERTGSCYILLWRHKNSLIWGFASCKKLLIYVRRPPASLQMVATIGHTIVNLGALSPCIIIHSNKSTDQIHQSLRFIARRLDTAQHVSDILMPIIRSL